MRGTGSTPSTTVIDAEDDASVSASSYELTSDVVRGRLTVMTMWGGGFVRIRKREMTVGSPTITSEGSNGDMHIGLGVGYELLRRPPFRLIGFGAFTQGLLSYDDRLNRRFFAGVQADVLTDRLEEWAISLRLALMTGSGTVDEDRELDASGILFQVGFMHEVRLR